MEAMTQILNQFGKKCVVLPVIHLKDGNQAQRNVKVARAAGADGVWLISHGEVPKSQVLA